MLLNLMMVDVDLCIFSFYSVNFFYEEYQYSRLRQSSKLAFDLCRTDKEMHRRQDMLANLRSRANQTASMLNMSNFANR